MSDDTKKDPATSAIMASQLITDGASTSKRKRTQQSQQTDSHELIYPSLSKVFKETTPFTKAIDLQFKSAIKEYGTRRQSKIQPNLNASKSRNVEKNTTNALSQNGGENAQCDDDGMSVMSDFSHNEEKNIFPSLNFINETNNSWQFPKRFNKVSKVNTTKEGHNVNLSNAYHMLEKDGEQSLADASSTERANASFSTNTNKNVKPPPIYCSHDSAKSLINALHQVIDKKSFILRDLSDKDQTIIAHNIDTFNKIKEHLKKIGIPYFTFTPKNERNKLLVLKGINDIFTPSEVEEELKSLNISDVTIKKIEKLKVNKNSTQKSHLLVQLDNNSIRKNLTNIKSILNLKIKWEIFRKKSVYQCHLCQRVGHSSVNCNLGFRCVKCNSKHEIGKCERKIDEKTPPICVNCEQEGHTANYRGCPYLKFAQVISQEYKTTSTKPKTTQIKAINDQPQNSYAYMAARVTQQPTTLQNQPRTSLNTSRDGASLQATLIASVENLLDSFKKDLIDTMTTQNYTIQNQIHEQNRKINFIFTKLNLKWTD